MRELLATACVLLIPFLVAAGASKKPDDSSLPFEGPINAAVLDKQSVVIIIPTNEADKETERQIHSCVQEIRKMFFRPDTPVVKDKEALERDLSRNPLMVYGTPGGNLWLAKHLAKLPVRIESDRIVADKPYPGTDLRFITAWPNPQNPKKGMVIYTAQQAKDVVNISVVFHGPTDYVVTRGTEVLKAADYYKHEGRWSFKPIPDAPHHRTRRRDIPLAAAIKDLDFFFRTVESVHPQPLAFVSPHDYLKLKRDARARLEDAASEQGGVAKSALAVTVAEAAAFFKDGHTNCFLPPDVVDQTDASSRMLPFHLEYQYGDIVIADTIEGLQQLRGRKLLKINGVDFVEFIGPILDKLSGERKAFRIRGFMQKQRVYWAMIPLVKENQVSITVQCDNGQTETLRIELISLQEYDDAIPEGPRSGRKNFHKFCHEERTCYWQYNSFVYSDKEKRQIDSLFALIMDKKVENLVIDLRFNSGGNSAAGDYILNYLAAKPYRMFSKGDVKLSKQLFGLGRQGGLKELEGLTVTWPVGLREPEDKGYRFEGKIFLLTGPDTFSSAAGFAAVVKDYGFGILIGEETGGLRQCFGDQLAFRLPNSGISFRVSYKRFYAPIPKPDDDRRGTVPDVVVDEQMLSPYGEADDPLLAFVLDYVREH